MLVMPAAGDPTIVVPRLEVGAAEQAPGIGAGGVSIRSVGRDRRPVRPRPGTLVPAGPAARLVVSDRLRAAFLLRLQAAFPDAASMSPARS